jgi:hypothetical protein
LYGIRALGVSGQPYTYPPAAATALTAIFAPRSVRDAHVRLGQVAPSLREVRLRSDRDSGTATGEEKVPSPGDPLRWDRRGIGRMVLAHVGVNRVPPGFARPREGASDPIYNRAASRVPANPVDDRRDEPVAASLGRSTIRRERRPYAVPSWGLVRSVGRRARPPSSGRPVRQRRNVKRSRRPPGATRKVSSRLLISTHHPEHGEAGRGQRLIAHTRKTSLLLPWLSGNQGMPFRRGPFFPFSQIA